MIYHLDPIQLQSIGPSHTSQHEITLQNPSNETVIANMQFISLHETQSSIADSIQLQIEDVEQKTLLSKNTLKQFTQTKEIIPLGTFLPNQEKKFILSITTSASIPETNQLQQAVFSIQTTFDTQETHNSSPTPIATSIPTQPPIRIETVFITNTPTPANPPQNQPTHITSLNQKTASSLEQAAIETPPVANQISAKKTETPTMQFFFIGILLVLFLLFFTGILFIFLRKNLKHA